MFKKQLVIFLAVIMALTFVACKSADNGEQAPADATTDAVETSDVVETPPLTEMQKYGEISLPDGYEQVGTEATLGHMKYENAETGTVVSVANLEIRDIDLETIAGIYRMDSGLTDEEIANNAILDTTVDGKPAKLLEVNVDETNMTSEYFFETTSGIKYIKIEHSVDNIAERDSIIANYKAE